MTRHLPVALALLVPLGGCSLPEAPAQTTAPPTTLDTELASVQQRAEEGDAAAQFKLGDMYRYGSGVPQDFAQALAWYSKAADQGYAEAQYQLGGRYWRGQGVPQDYVQAHIWYSLAASRLTGGRRHPAVRERDRVAGLMTSAQIAEAQRLAREFDAAHPREP